VCLAARQLTVTAGGETILGPIDFSVPPSTLAAVIGPNGSGKTTLLRAAAGLIAYRGSIEACDKPAYMPAVPQVDPLALALDVLKAGLYGSSVGVEQAVEEAEKLGVGSLLERMFHTLSSGEKRLVCIARALSRRSRLLLLDEPLAFLDVSNQARVLRALRDYAREKRAAVLASTHELHYLRFFDHVILLRGGSKAYEGPPGGLDKSLLEEVYGVELEEPAPGVYVLPPG